MNVFLIQAPLQALNALEARHHFGLSEESCHVVWFRSASARNDRQTGELLREGGWPHIHAVGYGGKSFRSWRERFSQVNGTARCVGAAHHIFVGDYAFDLMRHFAHSVPHQELVVLDDGNSTLLIDRARRDPAHRYHFLPRKLLDRAKYFLKTCCGRDGSVFDKLTYFTIYDLPPGQRTTVVHNSYEYLRGRLSAATRTEETFFLGDALPDKKMMSEQLYLAYLGRALRHLNQPKVVYLPHRLESAQKLRRIASDFGIAVGESTTPFEWRLCSSPTVPRLIAGFVTSALDSSRIICGPHIGIKSFYIDPEDCVPAVRREIAELYGHYAGCASRHFELVRAF